jgi:hypothetical protein
MPLALVLLKLLAARVLKLVEINQNKLPLLKKKPKKKKRKLKWVIYSVMITEIIFIQEI